MTAAFGLNHRLHLASTLLLGHLPDAVQLFICGEQPIHHAGQTLSPQLQFLHHRLQRYIAPHWSNLGTMTHIRARFNTLCRALTGQTIDIHRVTPLSMHVGTHTLAARWYQPFASEEPLPTLLFIHGGGYVLGNLDSHDAICRLLAAHAGIQVISIDYRLAPEHPFPAALDDCLLAWHWMNKHATVLNINPKQLMIGGDSVGAALATLTARELAACRLTPPHVQLLLYPSIDPTGTWLSHQQYADHFLMSQADRLRFFKLYLGHAQANDPRLMPILSQTQLRQAPALVVTAGFCPLRDEGSAYASWLAKQGGRVCHMNLGTLTHGFGHFIGVSNDCYKGMVDVAEVLSGLLVEQHVQQIA